jgi:mRNA deadenylase 3'-5' endonuclease subunit Ccr4
VQYLSKPLLPETALPKALEYRHQYLQESEIEAQTEIQTTDRSSSSPPTLRLVSFNILASAYAQSAYALSCMYDYLEHPEVLLSDEYRLQLVVKEMLAYR